MDVSESDETSEEDKTVKKKDELVDIARTILVLEGTVEDSLDVIDGAMISARASLLVVNELALPFVGILETELEDASVVEISLVGNVEFLKEA